jgi:hypothetical protein
MRVIKPWAGNAFARIRNSVCIIVGMQKINAYQKKREEKVLSCDYTLGNYQITS